MTPKNHYHFGTMHPLSSLFESRPESIAVPRPSDASLAEIPTVAEVAAPISPAIPQPPGRPLAGQLIAPGFSIIAFRELPGVDGQPGEIFFAPNLTPAARLAVAEDFAWWDRVDVRKARMERGVGECETEETENGKTIDEL